MFNSNSNSPGGELRPARIEYKVKAEEFRAAYTDYECPSRAQSARTLGGPECPRVRRRRVPSKVIARSNNSNNNDSDIIVLMIMIINRNSNNTNIDNNDNNNSNNNNDNNDNDNNNNKGPRGMIFDLVALDRPNAKRGAPGRTMGSRACPSPCIWCC